MTVKPTRFAVVKTAEEVIEYLKMGSGVGVDCTNMSKADAERIMTAIHDFQYTGIKRGGSDVMLLSRDKQELMAMYRLLRMELPNRTILIQ